MKLNEIDFDSMSNKELIQLSLKYKIIQKEDLYNISRKQLLRLIKQYIYKKLKVYGTREKEGVKTLKQKKKILYQVVFKLHKIDQPTYREFINNEGCLNQLQETKYPKQKEIIRFSCQNKNLIVKLFIKWQNRIQNMILLACILQLED